MARNGRTDLEKAIKRLQTDAWLGYIEQEYLREKKAGAGQYKLSDIAEWIDDSLDMDYSSAETLRQLKAGRDNKVMPAKCTLAKIDEAINGSRRVFEHGPLGTSLFRVLDLSMDSGSLLEAGMGIAREPLNNSLRQQRLSEVLAQQVRGLKDATPEAALNKLTRLVAWWRYALATEHSIDDVVVELNSCISQLTDSEQKGVIGAAPVNLELLKTVIKLLYEYSPRAKGSPMPDHFMTNTKRRRSSSMPRLG